MQQQNSELTFRSAVVADLEALVAMLADDELGAVRETPSLPLNAKYLQAFEQISNDPNNELLLAVAEPSLIVGMLQLTSDKTRPDAIRFYEKLGFVSSHEGMKLKL
jgi:hypothetical protein